MEVQFDLSAFSWFRPEKKTKWAVNIPNRRCLNINAELLKEIPHSILFGYNAEKRKLAIRAENESAFVVPKSGSIKAEKVITFIVDSGVRLPARFLGEKIQNVWIGTLEEQQLPSVLRNLPQRKRGKQNLSKAKKEEDQTT